MERHNIHVPNHQPDYYENVYIHVCVSIIKLPLLLLFIDIITYDYHYQCNCCHYHASHCDYGDYCVSSITIIIVAISVINGVVASVILIIFMVNTIIATVVFVDVIISVVVTVLVIVLTTYTNIQGVRRESTWIIFPRVRMESVKQILRIQWTMLPIFLWLSTTLPVQVVPGGQKKNHMQGGGPPTSKLVFKPH